MADPAHQDRLRLFFALWPDDEVCRQLALNMAAGGVADAMQTMGGRSVPPANHHVTLAFLGAVAGNNLAAIRAAAQRVRFRRFELQLCVTGYWPRAKIAWLGPAEVPAELVALVDQLWNELAGLGINREQRPFKPHISLARKATGCPEIQLESPICWRVTDFALAVSNPTPAGSVYTLLEQYSADG